MTVYPPGALPNKSTYQSNDSLRLIVMSIVVLLAGSRLLLYIHLFLHCLILGYQDGMRLSPFAI